MAKNVLMKYYNPATQTYQEVHPLTKTTNVYNNEGKTVQELIDEHEAAAAPHSGHETPAGAQAKVDAKTDIFAFDNLATKPNYYKVTEFDAPSPGDITETIKSSADGSVYATRITQFDVPAVGNITVTVQCAALGINNKAVTEFDTPAAGDIKETASEVV